MKNLRIKKLDLYMLKNFLGLFLMTFFICAFILLMQFMWMHVKDLVGKGIGLSILAEFFIYAFCSVVPLALPLAILLASLMSFGNLGERFELTAMKSAGISLYRIMRPLIFTVALISCGAFYFSNNVLPVSQTKLWALIFSLRQKSPEMEIPEGEFYDGIPGYNLYVSHKDHKTAMLYDMMIYDYSEGFQNAKLMVADSGKIYFTEDKKYLILKLFNGESFENLDQQQTRATDSRQRIPYRRETYSMKSIMIDFSTEFERFDESILQDQHVAKNVSQLMESIDSVKVLAHERSREQATEMINTKYFGRDRRTPQEMPALEEEQRETHDIDSLMASLLPHQRVTAMQVALDKAKAQADQFEYNAILLDEFKRYVRKHEVELHRKFTLAFACLIFFFIGAPLGAIIRKGGMGAPVVISVVMFIIYYIIDNTGYKMAREALWPCWAGMWLSSFVLLPIGVFLTYKATHDSALFNPEAWIKIWEQGCRKLRRALAPVRRRLEPYTRPIRRKLRPYWLRIKAFFAPLMRRIQAIRERREQRRKLRELERQTQ